MRIYLTAISIHKGIIQAIGTDGSLVYFRQRGISKFPDSIIKELVNKGYLVKNWAQFKELPSNITVSYEDPIQGRVKMSISDKDVEKWLGKSIKKTKWFI